ncbi:hypothetical protein E2C01_049458 [Portunus trituberculatus]|uniref:Uncharacterized protein n=1 Tax=Portunus trituberculatus TaxID=210409 RepID=A0A5B7GD53_PORTR|nr:hypothetical protein [Portunus trituberculatus]
MARSEPQDTPHYPVSSERNGGSRGPVGGGPHTSGRRHPLTPTPPSHLMLYHPKASLPSSTNLSHPHHLHPYPFPSTPSTLSTPSTSPEKHPKPPPPPAVDTTHCTPSRQRHSCTTYRDHHLLTTYTLQILSPPPPHGDT